jgi:hypothetical protein
MDAGHLLDMKRTAASLFLCLWLVACGQRPPEETATGRTGSLAPDFEVEFERLFLSEEPLRYQDNEAYLSAIQPEALSMAERTIVVENLKQFLLLEDQARDYAPDSLHTGVASEIAFLRLQSVQLLAQVGTSADIDFIQALTHDLEGEHPLFLETCELAIDDLADR